MKVAEFVKSAELCVKVGEPGESLDRIVVKPTASGFEATLELHRYDGMDAAAKAKLTRKGATVEAALTECATANAERLGLEV